MAKKPEKKYERECARCGEQFRAAKPNAKWCSDNCRKRSHDDAHRATCVDCGALMGARTGYSDVSRTSPMLRCMDCSRRERAAQADARAARYEALWAAGKTLQEIADELGHPHRFSVAAIISMYRAEGRNFPYRRSPEAVANIRATSAGAAEKRAARRLAA